MQLNLPMKHAFHNSEKLSYMLHLLRRRRAVFGFVFRGGGKQHQDRCILNGIWANSGDKVGFYG